MSIFGLTPEAKTPPVRYTETVSAPVGSDGLCVATFRPPQPPASIIGTITCDAVGAFAATVDGLPWSSWSGSQPSGTVHAGPSETITVAGSNLRPGTTARFTFIGTQYADSGPLVWPAAQSQSTLDSPSVSFGIGVSSTGVHGVILPPLPNVAWRIWMLGLAVFSNGATAGPISAYILDPQDNVRFLTCAAGQATATVGTGNSVAVPLGGLAFPPEHGLEVEINVVGMTAIGTAIWTGMLV